MDSKRHAQIRSLTAAARRVARQALARADVAAERLWEWRRYFGASFPSHGEMNAIVRRMGMGGFSEYAAAQMLGHFPRRSFLPMDREGTVAVLTERFPEQSRSAIEAADRVARGELAFFGSRPVDMRRGKRGSGYRLDWQRDPTTGERYPRTFNHYRWDPYRFRTGNADIKGPWELARCQHFVTLGQAYWLTGDERYATCYAKTVLDFLSRNPHGHGIHWACSMDVALRAVGWLTGLSFFQGSASLSYRWWRRFLKGLVVHGRFLAANLEFGNIDKRLVTSNHYIADLLGLYWIAVSFPHLDTGNVWRGLAERGLEREIRRQVLDDGGDFESSVPYHRLTIEMLLSAYALSIHFGAPLSEGFRLRLIAALRFVKALRQPGGRWPQIGDADNGRAHIFTGYGDWNQESLDHLLVAGAHVLGCPTLAGDTPKTALAERLFWGDGTPDPITLPAIPNPIVFHDFGVAVLRGGRSYISLSNGRVGTEGFGNHKHNDQLAVEWVLDRQPIFVDGGSYAYTSDPAARNHFRSAANHNTVTVDGLEQNSFDADILFRMRQEGKCGLNPPVSSDGCVGVSGFHTAYARLTPPVRHRRRVLVRPDGVVIIDDAMEGGRGRKICWHLLAYPGVGVEIVDGGAALKTDRGVARVVSHHIHGWRADRGWYSRGYGQREATVALFAENDSAQERFFLMFVPDGVTAPDIAAAVGFADTFFKSVESTGD